MGIVWHTIVITTTAEVLRDFAILNLRISMFCLVETTATAFSSIPFATGKASGLICRCRTNLRRLSSTARISVRVWVRAITRMMAIVCGMYSYGLPLFDLQTTDLQLFRFDENSEKQHHSSDKIQTNDQESFPLGHEVAISDGKFPRPPRTNADCDDIDQQNTATKRGKGEPD
ncbi:hypothetical protein BV898_14975 [Hypsibius exemplaris]|uniref:Uncharacterized protein n=1 Tax=Hypsibius exemplaris TaxID=2072580 RepID=A0A9X6ND07_HYPEX|nr:hypothetical protein BV898_14975 [Hypsibius exemplaris]